MQFYSLIRSKVVSVLALLGSKTSKQTFMLYGAQLLGIPCQMLSSAIVTRALGPDGYGILTFYRSVTNFSLLVFRFGLSSSAGLLVARQADESDRRKIIGAATIVFFLVGLSYSLFIFCSGFFIDNLFRTNIGHILKWAALPLMFAPYTFMISQITTGANRIDLLSGFWIMEPTLSLVGVLALRAASAVSVTSLIVLSLAIVSIRASALILCLRPQFKELRSSLRELFKINREYGIQTYWAQMTSQLTSKLDGILVSYFIDTTSLGFYSLAKKMSSPVSTFSASLSTSLFKQFASSKEIPKKVRLINLVWLVCCCSFLFLASKPIVYILYGASYEEVVNLLRLSLLSVFFMGIKQPYVIFLGAKGKGVWKRNIGLIVAATSLLSSIFLIPTLGTLGAVMAAIFSQLVAFVMHIWYYRKLN